jgi:hypothetical protein
MIGVYLVWAGSSQPGGAFQGGTVLAAVALLADDGGLVRPLPVGSRAAARARRRSGCLSGGGPFGCGRGQLPGAAPTIAKPLILGIETALTLSIAATLACWWSDRARGPVSERGRMITQATLYSLTGAAVIGVGVYGFDRTRKHPAPSAVGQRDWLGHLLDAGCGRQLAQGGDRSGAAGADHHRHCRGAGGNGTCHRRCWSPTRGPRNRHGCREDIEDGPA